MEVNKRINYPLKEVLNQLVHDGQLCMEDPAHQYCCSWLSLRVANVGTRLFVTSWNSHPIPGNPCSSSLWSLQNFDIILALQEL